MDTRSLTISQLQKTTPSAFAINPAERVSGRYGFIPTVRVMEAMQDSGFIPVDASQTRSRVETNKGHTKHMVRFRMPGCEGTKTIGGLVPEIILVNSHDGTTAYQLRAGLFRLVCSNGLIVGNDMFCKRVKHHGNAIEKVVEGAKEIIEIFPKAVEVAGKWQTMRLTDPQRSAYAESALQLKWEENEDLIVSPTELLKAKRWEDRENNLWTTFNVLQENLIRGGVRYRKKDVLGEFKKGTTRAVNSISENVRLNTALWTLTEKMAELLI